MREVLSLTIRGPVEFRKTYDTVQRNLGKSNLTLQNIQFLNLPTEQKRLNFNFQKIKTQFSRVM